MHIEKNDSAKKTSTCTITIYASLDTIKIFLFSQTHNMHHPVTPHLPEWVFWSWLASKQGRLSLD